jgi:hypothetical protein
MCRLGRRRILVRVMRSRVGTGSRNEIARLCTTRTTRFDSKEED